MKSKIARLETRLSRVKKNASFSVTDEMADSYATPGLYEDFQNEFTVDLKSAFKNIKMSKNSFEFPLSFLNGKIVAKHHFGLEQESIEHDMISYQRNGSFYIEATLIADGIYEEILKKKMPIKVFFGVGYSKQRKKTNSLEIVNKIKNEINYYLAMQDLPSVK